MKHAIASVAAAGLVLSLGLGACTYPANQTEILEGEGAEETVVTPDPSQEADDATLNETTIPDDVPDSVKDTTGNAADAAEGTIPEEAQDSNSGNAVESTTDTTMAG